MNANHVRFLTSSGTKMGDLPEATISERSDLIEGWEIGMGLGALLGFELGLVALSLPDWWYTKPLPTLATLAICTLIGLVVGGYWTAFMATTIPNTKLKPFEKQISEGNVLMMVLVPLHRINEVKGLILKKHPEAIYRGIWPSDHVMFP